MSPPLSLYTSTSLPPFEKPSGSASISGTQSMSTHIHNLDDDSLLNIFYFCRSSFFGRDERDTIWLGEWRREYWWYKLLKVCQRWRYVILESASHLGLCLVCTHGTPVEDILAHSPPLPLSIGHDEQNHGLTAKHEEGILIALQYRDRVRRIHLRIPVPGLQRLITAMDGAFPVLEYLYIMPRTRPNTRFTLPPTFQAPHLRYLVLQRFTSPIRSPLLTTAIGLVALSLRWIDPSTYLHPGHLLQTLSLLSQLKSLEMGFCSPVPNNNIERQLLHTPMITHATLPSLRWFSFWGVSAYLEALLPNMTAPLLRTFRLHFFNQLSFPLPRLLQFMTTTESLIFRSAKFLFHDEAVAVFVQPHEGINLINFSIDIPCKHLDWQVSSMAQIFNVPSPLSSTVADVDLDYREHSLSPAWHNQADRMQWRQLLRSFSNVKTLRVHSGLIGELSRSLRSDGDPPLELLPHLEELICPVGSRDGETFAQFIHERELSGKPVNLTEKIFPVGRNSYEFDSSAGVIHVGPDPHPVS